MPLPRAGSALVLHLKFIINSFHYLLPKLQNTAAGPVHVALVTAVHFANKHTQALQQYFSNSSRSGTCHSCFCTVSAPGIILVLPRHSIRYVPTCDLRCSVYHNSIVNEVVNRYAHFSSVLWFSRMVLRCVITVTILITTIRLSTNVAALSNCQASAGVVFGAATRPACLSFFTRNIFTYNC